MASPKPGPVHSPRYLTASGEGPSWLLPEMGQRQGGSQGQGHGGFNVASMEVEGQEEEQSAGHGVASRTAAQGAGTAGPLGVGASLVGSTLYGLTRSGDVAGVHAPSPPADGHAASLLAAAAGPHAAAAGCSAASANAADRTASGDLGGTTDAVLGATSAAPRLELKPVHELQEQLKVELCTKVECSGTPVATSVVLAPATPPHLQHWSKQAQQQERLSAGSAALADQLCTAARDGDLAAVQRLLAQGAPVHQLRGKELPSMPPLMLANGKDGAEIMRVLLAAGALEQARADGLPSLGGDALFNALTHSYYDMARQLVDAGVRARDSTLFWRRGRLLQMFTLIGYQWGADGQWWLQYGRDPEVNAHQVQGAAQLSAGREEEGEVPYCYRLVWQAVLHAELEDLQLLLEAGLPPQFPDAPTQDPPLILAAHRGRVDMAQALIAAGADVNCRDAFMQRTPLFLAADQRNMALLRLLVQSGADDSLRDLEGRSVAAAVPNYARQLKVVTRQIKAAGAAAGAEQVKGGGGKRGEGGFKVQVEEDSELAPLACQPSPLVLQQGRCGCRRPAAVFALLVAHCQSAPPPSPSLPLTAHFVFATCRVPPLMGEGQQIRRNSWLHC